MRGGVDRENRERKVGRRDSRGGKIVFEHKLIMECFSIK